MWVGGSSGYTPKDCSLLGSSIRGIFQARVLQWFANSFSKGSFLPRDQTRVSCIAAIWETRVLSLGQEDPLEKEKITHSSTLASKIPRIEEPDGLQSMGSQRVGPTELLHFLSLSSGY